MPDNIEPESFGSESPIWLQPAGLKPAAKQLLDLLYDWPGISPEQLRLLMGVSRARLYEIMASPSGAGLIQRVSVGGRRLALSDRGLALLARRDRVSVGAARRRWSVAPTEPDVLEDWRSVSGRNSRQLLRNIEHTGSVHDFLAAVAHQAGSLGWEVVQLDPPSRASRYFRHLGGLRSVNPDAYGLLRRADAERPFFLEWERRAVRPTTMAQRLAPYLRYYATQRPLDDHGAIPAVLVVFEDDLAATHFLGLATEEMERTRVEVPMGVSHRELLLREGPMGRAWLRPGEWETTVALENVSARR
jgi:DNA-binding MarR family transcriptional regulator